MKIRSVPRIAALLAASSAGACHGGQAGVVFHGSSHAPVVTPLEVVEARALPRGSARLGRLYAHCEAVGWDGFEDRALADVDCSEARLRRMLREVAAENGGDVLASAACQRGKSSSCSAVLGRTARAGSRAAVPVRASVLGARGSAVSVDFEPQARGAKRSPREAEAVNELPLLPPSHRVVGSFSTECSECSELETRDALRIAAGRLGASDVIGVRCVPWGPGFRCAGSAAVTLVEP